MCLLDINVAAALLERFPENTEKEIPPNLYAIPPTLDSCGHARFSLATAAELPLRIAFADDLPDEFTPPDELVEGMLTTGGGSVLYGDSNSGKTFFAIDMAAAVARGVDWMGRRTEPGMVVYIAAESPASVSGRLQAYQKYHGVRLPNFAIVQNTLNLFRDKTDTEAVITAVRLLEEQRKQKVRLIVGDTLARLSAGANENAGQDMGLVIERFDRIRTECEAHFMLIHHSGKNAAAGARGWSGVRAAVDVEIEVTEMQAGRCAEITKNRDLGSKGERIGFRLDVVQMGVTKWGTRSSSCVVASADAPVKRPGGGKRFGKIERAILAFLSAQKGPVSKTEVVVHLDGRHDKGPVYRAMQKLAESSLIREDEDMVCLVEAPKY